MIKEDANIENLATQNDNNDKKIIMIKIDEIKEYEEKQNYLDNKQNNFDDMENLNLIIRDKIIQNKDEQKDFDEMNKLSMSKNDKNDEMQLSCKEGDKMFSSNLRPNGHWQPVHEGVQYPCNLCNYKAKQKSELKTHLKTIHRRLYYLCGQCGYTKFQSKKHQHARNRLGPTYFNNPF